jgi:hypothetical protein
MWQILELQAIGNNNKKQVQFKEDSLVGDHKQTI